MIERLKLWWLNFRLWWWTRGMDSNRRFHHRMETLDDVNDEEPFVRAISQSLHEVEIDDHPYILPECPRWLVEALKPWDDD